MYRAPLDCEEGGLPVQGDLDALFDAATEVRIREGGTVDGRSLGGRLLARVRGGEIGELLRLLALRPGGQPFHCMCHGDLALEIDRPAGGAVVGVHHGLSLRLHGWSSDVELADGRALLAWLAERGEPGPLEGFDAAVEAGRAAQGHRRTWLDAAPPILLPRLRELESDGMGLPRRAGHSLFAEALDLLRAAYPSEAGLARALLVWLAHGAGPWSGFPAYEGLPQDLLEAVGVSTVIDAVEADAWTGPLLRGAARFVAWHDVVRFRRRELMEVDDALWLRMLDEVRELGDPDNLARLEGARAAVRDYRQIRTHSAPFQVKGGLWLVAQGEGASLRHFGVQDGALFALDLADVVRFEPDSTTPRPLWRGPDHFADLAVGPGVVLVTHVNAGVVHRLDPQTGVATQLGSERGRPMNPAVGGGELYWVEAPFVTDPVRGAPYSAQDKRLVRPGPTGELESLATFDGSTLQVGARDVVWSERPEKGQLALWRRSHDGGEPQELLRRELARGKNDFFNQAFAATDEAIFFTDVQEGAVYRTDRGGAKVRRVLSTPHLPRSLVADERDLFVLVADDDSTTTWLHRVPAGGEASVVAEYQRQRPDPMNMALDAHRVYLATGAVILAFDRHA